MIVADTSALVALIDRSDRHHQTLRTLYERDPDAWVLPWAVLPEVDYLIGTHVGSRAQQAFLADVAEGLFGVAWGDESDLEQARQLTVRHRGLGLGLVDAVVIGTAVRLKARAIATLDLRHFAALTIPGRPKLLPRDL